MLSPTVDGRLLVVSNRLPLSINHECNTGYHCEPSSGGLVTALAGLAKGGWHFTWYGWPGIEIPDRDIEHMRKLLLHQHNAVPVLLNQQLAKNYYDGFSNSTLWPLFHHQTSLVTISDDYATAYREANDVFADTIAADMRDGDHIWVHDYHLMLLPQLLRQRSQKMGIKIRIGWFLHTHFPENDIFALLPSGEEILNGTTGADVVGFQTKTARRNYLSNFRKLSPRHTSELDFTCNGRLISIGIFPIGVEPSEFHQRLLKSSVRESIRMLQRRGRKIVVGIDRLDIIKGIPQKLRAFETFLEHYPEWIGRVSLVQLVIPSRANLEMNQRLRKEIQHIAESINNKYGNKDYMPVDLLYKSIEPEELTALYTAANVCFVSSIRDGMNLVSFEYVACHNRKAEQCFGGPLPRGILILSKYTGAADIMKGSLVVDPWNPHSCAEALACAMNMREDEARQRMIDLGAKVEKYTSLRWATSFVETLKRDQRRDSAVDLTA